MKSKRGLKRQQPLKSGFETDQPLEVGKRYRFVYTDMPGGVEVSATGVYVEELTFNNEQYYSVLYENYAHMIPIDRTLEVNEVIAGE